MHLQRLVCAWHLSMNVFSLSKLGLRCTGNSALSVSCDPTGTGQPGGQREKQRAEGKLGAASMPKQVERVVEVPLMSGHLLLEFLCPSSQQPP